MSFTFHVGASNVRSKIAKIITQLFLFVPCALLITKGQKRVIIFSIRNLFSLPLTAKQENNRKRPIKEKLQIEKIKREALFQNSEKLK